MTKQNKTTGPEMAKHDHLLKGLYFNKGKHWSFYDDLQYFVQRGDILSAQAHGREDV